MSNLIPKLAALRHSILPNVLRSERKFEINWNFRSDYLLLFLVFGYFGWGTTGGLASIFSIPNLMTSSALALSLGIIFLRRAQSSHLISVRINFRMIFAFLGFFSLGVMINWNLLRNSLTLDEIAYAWASQLQSYVIAIQFSSYLPEYISSLNASLILQLIAIAILGSGVLWVKLLLKLRNDVHFVIITVFATFGLRAIVQFLGGANSPNSPLANLWYFITSTLFGVNNVAYRLSTSVLFAGLATYLLLSLGKIQYIPKTASILTSLLIYTTPLLINMSISVEIAIWTFFVTVIFILRLVANNCFITNNLMLFLAVSFYLRVNLIILFISSCFSILFTRRNSLRKELARLLPYVTLILPGLFPVLTGRLSNRIGNDNLDVTTVVNNFENTYRSIEQSGSMLYFFVGLVVLIVSFSRKEFRLFIVTWVALNFLFFIILNSSGLTLQSKYVIEYLYPIVLSVGSLFVFRRIFLGKAIVISLVLLNLFGLSISTQVIENFRNSYDPIYGVVGETYSSIPFLPLPYREAFIYLRENKIEDCFNTGIVYSSFPEVLEGLSLANVSKQRNIRTDFLASQLKLGESWATVSSESLRLSQIECVILGSINSQGLISRKLENEGWTVIANFRDLKFGTLIQVLTLTKMDHTL